MTGQTFSCIMPRSPATVIAPCKKETWSTSRLCRGRRARKLPTWLRLRDEEVGNYSAGRERPPAGLFYLETGFSSVSVAKVAACFFMLASIRSIFYHECRLYRTLQLHFLL